MKRITICCVLTVLTLALALSGCDDKMHEVVLDGGSGGTESTVPGETVDSVLNMQLNRSSATLQKGDTIVLSVTSMGEADARAPYDEKLVWRSSNPAVAIVDNGVVTALSNGYATITATTTDNRRRGASAVAVNPYETITVGNVSFRMNKVEAGTFYMGASPDMTSSAYAERPGHEVTLTNDYYIADTEVTQALWEEVMGERPSKVDSLLWTDENGLGADYPAYNISFQEVENFLEKLNRMTGKQFRLPTEAEWEFAAHGGNSSQGYLYPGGNSAEDVAWYRENSDEQLHEVKGKTANELGLYDMGGNVEEWCNDWYDMNYYTISPSVDPRGPLNASYKVVRGGDYTQGTIECRCVFRNYHSTTTRHVNLGLRLAL